MATVATGRKTIIDLSDDKVVSSTAPVSPVVDMLWMDSSSTPNVLKRWSGSSWVVVSNFDPEEYYTKSESNTEFNRLSTAIEAKASKSVTDSLGNRISSAEAELIIQAESIASKVSQDEYDTAMEQTAQAISAKADGTTVDELSGTVSSLNTKVDINTGGITALTSRVETNESRITTAESSIAAVPGEINMAVSGISIGGRNLLINTTHFDEWYMDAESGFSTNNFNYNEMYLNANASFDNHHYISSYPKMNYIDIKNKDIVFSFDYCVDSGSLSGSIAYSLKLSNSNSKDNITTGYVDYSISGSELSTVWKTKELKIHIDDSIFTSGHVIGNEQYLFVEFNNLTNVDIRIKNIKFEIGNKKTDWTPAPEDGSVAVDTGNESVRVKITNNTFDVNVNGGDSEMVINDSGAVFGNVTITKDINAPSLLKLFPAGDYSIGLPPAGDTRTYVRVYSTLADFMNDVSYKTVTGFTSVYINKDISESVTLIGTNGIRLNFDFLNHEMYGSIRLSSCGCGEIVIQNLKLHATTTGTLLYLDGCKYVNVTNVSFYGHNLASQMLYLLQGTHSMIIDCGFYDEVGNTATGIFAAYTTSLFVQNMKGGVHNAFIGAGCSCCWYGTRALGQILFGALCLLNPSDLSSLPTDPGEGGQGGGSEPVTVAFTATHTRNCRATGSWDSLSYAQTSLNQNYYNNIYQKGCVWFDIPSGTLDGKVIKSIALRLHRPSSGYGTTAAISVKIAPLAFTYEENRQQARILPNTVTGDNYYIDSTYNTFVEIGTIQRNEQKDFDIPITNGLVQNIIANHGFALFGGETKAASGHNYSANYGTFSGAATDLAPQLLITYTDY